MALDQLRLIPQNPATLQALAQQVLCWARRPNGTADPRIKTGTAWNTHIVVPPGVCQEYGAPAFTSMGQAITCPAVGEGQKTYYIMETDVSPLNPVDCTSPDAIATPTGLAAGTPTDTTVPLTWNAVADATAYHVQYRVAGAQNWTDWTPDPTGTSVTVTGLTANTAYEFRIRAVAANPADSSAYSGAIAAATTLTPLAAPAGLAAGTVTATTIPLTWSAVTGAVGYVVRWRVEGTTPWTTRAQVATTSDTITGLTASTDYEVQVQAVGNGTTTASSAFGPTTPLAVSTTA